MSLQSGDIAGTSHQDSDKISPPSLSVRLCAIMCRQCNDDQQRTPSQAGQQLPPAWRSSEPPREWCKCGHCRSMSQEIENVCCKERKCITEQARFQKVCLDADVLELQYCAKGIQMNFDEIRGFSGLFKEISLRAIFPRYFSAFS